MVKIGFKHLVTIKGMRIAGSTGDSFGVERSDKLFLCQTRMLGYVESQHEKVVSVAGYTFIGHQCRDQVKLLQLLGNEH